jgi:hypothetical protein
MDRRDLTKRDMTVIDGERTGTRRAYRRRGAGRDGHGNVMAPTSAMRKEGGMETAALSYKLRDVARSGGWTTERAVARIAGIDPADPDFPTVLGHLLEAINRAEDAQGRPLLAAVVVGATGLPGPGFFASARELGLHVDSDDRTLWQRELQRVHAYWYRH